MKQKFMLTKSNKIYFGIIVTLFIVPFFMFSDMTPQQTGSLLGKLFQLLLLPSLFAWIVWRVRGRKEQGGSLTFNFTLTLLLLVQIGLHGNKANQYREIKELKQQKEEFKKEISSTDDPAKLDAAYDKFTDTVQEKFSRLSQISTGEEKKFYEIMLDFSSKSEIITREWNDSFNAILEPRILDYSLLNNDEEFDHQRKILRHYIETTKKYNEFLINRMIPDLQKRMSKLKTKDDHFERAIQEVLDQYIAQKTILKPILQEHIKYGTNMINILNILETNKDQWSYNDDELEVYSDPLLKDYEKLANALLDNETTINTLAEKNDYIIMSIEQEYLFHLSALAYIRNAPYRTYYPLDN